jgi:hypothetical protein
LNGLQVSFHISSYCQAVDASTLVGTTAPSSTHDANPGENRLPSQPRQVVRRTWPSLYYNGRSRSKPNLACSIPSSDKPIEWSSHADFHGAGRPSGAGSKGVREVSFWARPTVTWNSEDRLPSAGQELRSGIFCGVMGYITLLSAWYNALRLPGPGWRRSGPLCRPQTQAADVPGRSRSRAGGLCSDRPCTSQRPDRYQTRTRQHMA